MKPFWPLILSILAAMFGVAAPVRGHSPLLREAIGLNGEAMFIDFDEGDPMAGIGLGWITVAAQGHLPMIMQKSGSLAGFMTYIAFAPGRDVGVFVAVNRADFAMLFGLTAAVNDLIANLVTR
jgi:CubicO group peptidase (beta-lactamase class C family)